MDSITIPNPFDRLGFSSTMDKIASMIKAGDYKLPDDPAQWNAAIQDAIESQHPEVIKAGSNPHIVYKHKDWGSGCALGSLSVAVGRSLIVFPIVIRYGGLATFDMVYDHERDLWIHASEENMRAYTSGDQGLLGKVTTKQITGDNEYDDRWEYLRAPRGSHKGASFIFTTKEAMASCPVEPLEDLIKYASQKSDRLYYAPKRVLDKLAQAHSATVIKNNYENTGSYSYDDNKPFEKEDGQSFEEPSRTEDELGCIKTAFDIVQTVIDDRLPKPSEEATEVQVEEIDEDLNNEAFKCAAYDFFDMLHIKKAGLGVYDMTLGRRGFDGSYTIQGDINKVASVICGSGDEESLKLAAKILDSVDEADGLLLDAASDDVEGRHTEILGDKNVIDNAKRITRFGVYDVFTEEGQRQTGHVLPVFDWTGEQSQAFLFVSECDWALQSNINGTASQSMEFCRYKR